MRNSLRAVGYRMEKRSYPRIEISHPVIYFPDVHPRPKIAKTLDLSMGGTKIESRYGLVKDEGLKITICTDSEVLKCRGKVVHVTGMEDGRMEAGIEFEELSKGDRIYLGQYLSYMMDRQARASTENGCGEFRVHEE